jgi:hypothetical protein
MSTDSTTTSETARDVDSLLVELGRLQGQVKVLEERLAAADAADEQHRVELDAARAEAADAQAALRESQARAEEWRRQVEDFKARLVDSEAQRRRAEDERTAIIDKLGRRARRQLDRT